MVLATLIPCVLCSGVLAEPNAAEAWYVFFDQIDGIEIPQGDMDRWSTEDQAQYEKLAPLIYMARALALNTNCDWGIDYSAGLNMELTHLSPLRNAAKLIHFSMRGDMQAGNTESALAGMQSLLGITSHYQADGLLISSLVTTSTFKMAMTSASLVDGVSDPAQLETMLQSLDTFDTFDPFGIRRSIGFESEMMSKWLASDDALKELGIDFSADQLDTQMANYKSVMDQAVAIFAMPNEEEALEAADALISEIDAQEYGFVAMLMPTIDRLLETAFQASSELEEFRTLLEARIKLLRAPKAASYFLQAVETYAAIDPESREEALRQGDYEVIGEALQLLAKAASMEPVLITRTDDPSVPPWLAPLHSMTIYGLARGTLDDIVTAIRVAGHLSQQDRLSASIAAANIIKVVGRTEFTLMTQDERNRMSEATRMVPSADAFMLLAARRSDTKRLIDWFEIEGVWKPESIAILAATLTLTREQNIVEQWPIVWPQFIDMLAVPDDDFVIVAAVQERMLDALLFASFQRSVEFENNVRNAGRELLSLRQKLTRLPIKQ